MTKGAIALGFLGMLSMPLAANAALVTGTLNFTGTAQISLGTVGFLSNVYFINQPGAAQTGGWVAFEGTQGDILNITNPPDATGSLNVPMFMTFNAAPNISITLTFLFPGIDGTAGCSFTPAQAASGQQCTPNLPAQSPYNLQNTSATSSTASFNILGTEVDTTTGNTISVTGEFSTVFTNQNYEQILATVEGGGTVTTSFAGQLATVPEPGTLVELMLGLGVIGISVASRRRFTKQQ
jgi:hypothetical protein